MSDSSSIDPLLFSDPEKWRERSMKNIHEQIYHPFPNGYDEFIALREAVGDSWIYAERSEVKKEFRPHRTAAFYPNGQVWYIYDKITCDIGRVPLIKQYKKAAFATLQQQEAQQEMACYHYAGALGFQVPERVTYHGNLAIADATASFETVFAVSHINGKTIFDVMRDPNISEEKKDFISDEGVYQGIALGLTYCDPDRVSGHNIFVCDLKEEKPQDFVQNDFEFVRRQNLFKPPVLIQTFVDYWGTESLEEIKPDLVIKRLGQVMENLERNAEDIRWSDRRKLKQNIIDGLRFAYDSKIRGRFSID